MDELLIGAAKPLTAVAVILIVYVTIRNMRRATRGHSSPSGAPSRDTDGERQLKAPWTDPQVLALNEYQQSGIMHPFTCPETHVTIHDDTLDQWRKPGPDEDWHPWHVDHVTLVATNDGWSCPAQTCSYTQDWAWTTMTDRDTIRASKAQLDALSGS